MLYAVITLDLHIIELTFPNMVFNLITVNIVNGLRYENAFCFKFS